MGNRGHLKPHFFEITLMQFVNILEIPLMRFLSISEMEFVAPESRLKQQEAITTTTVKRITATEHPELKKQLQTRILLPLFPIRKSIRVGADRSHFPSCCSVLYSAGILIEGVANAENRSCRGQLCPPTGWQPSQFFCMGDIVSPKP